MNGSFAHTRSHGRPYGCQDRRTTRSPTDPRNDTDGKDCADGAAGGCADRAGAARLTPAAPVEDAPAEVAQALIAGAEPGEAAGAESAPHGPGRGRVQPQSASTPAWATRNGIRLGRTACSGVIGAWAAAPGHAPAQDRSCRTCR